MRCASRDILRTSPPRRRRRELLCRAIIDVCLRYFVYAAVAIFFFFSRGARVEVLSTTRALRAYCLMLRADADDIFCCHLLSPLDASLLCRHATDYRRCHYIVAAAWF